MSCHAPEYRWSPELVTHRRFLLGLARRQLGHDGEADDVVQDTLLAAAEASARFSGEVPLRSWLSGILRHKIVDALRSRSRQQPLVEAGAPDGDEDACWGGLPDGWWCCDPAVFVDTRCPESVASQRQMLERLAHCLQALPPRSAQLLLMRDYLGMSTEEIADQTELTPGNQRVLLHRTRTRLKQCLARTWNDAS